MFKIALSIVFLMVLSIACQQLVTLSGWPLPAPLVGLLLLFAGLKKLNYVPDAFAKVCLFGLKHMSVFFVPAVLSVVLFAGPLAEHAVVIVSSLILTTALSLGITAWICDRVVKKESDV